MSTTDQSDNLDRDDVEAHSFRRMLDDQSAPAADDTPAEDDTEGHARVSVKFQPDEDDTEGHMSRGRG